MSPPELRLFLALWPPPQVVEALRTHARLWRWPPAARPVPDKRLHLTLHFIGNVPAQRLDELIPGLAVRCEPLQIVLDVPQLWPGGVAVLSSSSAHGALACLHEELSRALLALGLPVEQRPFRPHVTLARRAAGALPPAGCPPLGWPHPPGYQLVQSLPGGVGYRTLALYGPAGARPPA